MEINISKMMEDMKEGWANFIRSLQDPRAMAEQFRDMSTLRKFSLAGVVLLMVLAGVYIGLNWSYWTGKHEDPTVRGLVQSRQIGQNPGLPISPSNPAVTVTNHIFIGPQGKLEIVDNGNNRSIHFTPALGISGWNDQWARLAAQTDGIKRMLMLAGIGIAQHRPWGITADANLSAEQAQGEADIAQSLLADVATLQDSVQTGTYQPSQAEAVSRVLTAYDDKREKCDDAKKAADDARSLANGEKDSSKSAALSKTADAAEAALAAAEIQRTAAATEVMKAGMAYALLVEDGYAKAINKYMDDVDKLLDAPQHELLRKASTTFALHSSAPAKDG